MAAVRAIRHASPDSTSPLESQAAGEDTAGATAPYERSSSDTHLRATRAPEETALDSGFAVTVVPPATAVGSDGEETKPEGIVQAEERLLGALRGGDLANALTVASVLVYMDPSNELARRIKDRCAQQMEGKRTVSFPRHDAVPRQCVPWSELRRRTLSRSEAYLLWCVDGRSTVEEIVDASAMPPLLAFETLDALIREGIVDLS